MENSKFLVYTENIHTHVYIKEMIILHPVLNITEENKVYQRI